MIGTKLAHFQITAHLGSGGMGDVYQATDSKLGRNVAIKLLPEAFARDSERVARFEREARVLASLNHPNIAGIYGFERADDRIFLVMEFVPGETLAERIHKGRVPIDEALAIAKEIADALEAAHEKSIVHRDLKPANVKITPEGKVKVLDFGLAKAYEPEHINLALSNSPTLMSVAGTNAGVILGTAAYMSPEQAKGLTTNSRSDIFSFGCVLYEMLTGKQTFDGETVSDIIASVIKVEADIDLLPVSLSPHFKKALRRCLEKNPKQRWQAIGDVRWEIQNAIVEPVAAAAVAVEKKRNRSSVGVAALAGLLLLSTLILGAAWLIRRDAPGFGVIRVDVTPPEKTTLRGSPFAPRFAISPDGRKMVFGVDDDKGTQLRIRSFDSSASQLLTEANGLDAPFWSPDGRAVGYFSDGKLKRIEISGGSPITLCSANQGIGSSSGTWNSGGIILFTPGLGSGLFRVSENGGVPQPVTKLDDAQETAGHLFPQFLPDGRHFIYLVMAKGGENTGAYVGSLDGGPPHLLIRTQVRVEYASGYLLFVRDNGVLMAQPLDTKRLALTGEPSRVAEQVSINPSGGSAGYVVSESGALAYRVGVYGASQQLVWLDRKGQRIPLQADLSEYRTHDLSPDGKKIAVHRHDPSTGKGDIWIIDAFGGKTTRFTFENTHSFAPVWSPDGDRIVYASVKNGNTADLYQRLSNGAATEELLLQTPESKHPVDWSRDGRYILYESLGRQTQLDLWVLPLFGDKKPIPFLNTPFNERKGRFSPDGKFIAYTSNESGADQVYIQPFPPNGGKWQVSTNGGFEPRWRADGKELYYISGTTDSKVMAVAVKWLAIPEPGPPQAIVDIHNTIIYGVDAANQYIATADGQRFLFIGNAAPDSETPDSMTVLFNWVAGLKR